MDERLFRYMPSLPVLPQPRMGWDLGNGVMPPPCARVASRFATPGLNSGTIEHRPKPASPSDDIVAVIHHSVNAGHACLCGYRGSGPDAVSLLRLLRQHRLLADPKQRLLLTNERGW